MARALQLAALGRGHVSPNPMVGCVIELAGRIIGEGWHHRYGDWHAEVNAIHSVRPEDVHLLPDATVYVTLEPCSHSGKTPPCADLLIEHKVKRVVCCNGDPNPLVSGQGFARLRAAGIEVETEVLAEQGRALNARFFTFFDKKRPFILLKWAETTDGFVAGEANQPIPISGDLSHRLVHRWRSEEDAIMVGTTTARVDNPRLTNRLWPMQAGLKNPTRLVIDRNLSLPAHLHLFDGAEPTIVYHEVGNMPSEQHPQVSYVLAHSLADIMADLYQRRIQSVLVEGGTRLIQSFLEAGLWDEMRVFRSPILLGKGVKAPVVAGKLISRQLVGPDELSIYRPEPTL